MRRFAEHPAGAQSKPGHDTERVLGLDAGGQLVEEPGEVVEGVRSAEGAIERREEGRARSAFCAAVIDFGPRLRGATPSCLYCSRQRRKYDQCTPSLRRKAVNSPDYFKLFAQFVAPS
jgi:hypothetical protein